jgi:hypothetical protein
MTLGMRSLDDGRDDAPAAPGTSHDAVRVPGLRASTEADAGIAPERWRWPTAVWCVVLAGAALLAIGAVLPWAEASSASASFSSAGIDGNGGVALLAAVALGLLVTLTRRPKLAAGLMIGIAVATGAIALHDARDIAERADRLMERVPAVSAGVGVGVWLTLAGAAIALVGGMIALVVATRPTADRPDLRHRNGQTPFT